MKMKKVLEMLVLGVVLEMMPQLVGANEVSVYGTSGTLLGTSPLFRKE